MRTVESYYDQMEALREYFGEVGMVTKRQVAQFTGRSERWVHDRLGVGRNGVTLPVLARRLLEVCNG